MIIQPRHHMTHTPVFAVACQYADPVALPHEDNASRAIFVERSNKIALACMTPEVEAIPDSPIELVDFTGYVAEAAVFESKEHAHRLRAILVAQDWNAQVIPVRSKYRDWTAPETLVDIAYRVDELCKPEFYQRDLEAFATWLDGAAEPVAPLKNPELYKVVVPKDKTQSGKVAAVTFECPPGRRPSDIQLGSGRLAGDIVQSFRVATYESGLEPDVYRVGLDVPWLSDDNPAYQDIFSGKASVSYLYFDDSIAACHPVPSSGGNPLLSKERENDMQHFFMMTADRLATLFNLNEETLADRLPIVQQGIRAAHDIHLVRDFGLYREDVTSNEMTPLQNTIYNDLQKYLGTRIDSQRVVKEHQGRV